jgi:hypothetical protein
MPLNVPVVLEALKGVGAAVKALQDQLGAKKTAIGQGRTVVAELKNNMSYLDLVADGEQSLGEILPKLSTASYKKLRDAGYDFNTIEKAKITAHPTLKNTDLASWAGRDTASLIEAIYDRIEDLLIKYPHAKKSRRYRWNVRVNNIRKRIMLLTKHLAD